MAKDTRKRKRKTALNCQPRKLNRSLLFHARSFFNGGANAADEVEFTLDASSFRSIHIKEERHSARGKVLTKPTAEPVISPRHYVDILEET